MLNEYKFIKLKYISMRHYIVLTFWNGRLHRFRNRVINYEENKMEGWIHT